MRNAPGAFLIWHPNRASELAAYDNNPNRASELAAYGKDANRPSKLAAGSDRRDRSRSLSRDGGKDALAGRMR